MVKTSVLMNRSASDTMQKAELNRVALILPACHEEDAITAVLDELASCVEPQAGWIFAVGVNGSPAGVDRTALLARRHPLAPLVAETAERGYGFGCQAAIDLVEAKGLRPDAYIFFAADGANDPGDLARILAAHRAGFDFVIGCRTAPQLLENRAVMGWPHVLANRLLGAWCELLTGRRFRDIGPFRLIERQLFHRLRLREWTFGWTIEAQITAARLGASMTEVPVRERPRRAGRQKVSKVSAWQTLRIGWKIVAAGWRARCRFAVARVTHPPAVGDYSPPDLALRRANPSCEVR